MPRLAGGHDSPFRKEQRRFLYGERAARALCQVVLFLFEMARHRGGLEQEKRRHCGSVGGRNSRLRAKWPGEMGSRGKLQTLPED